MEYPKRLLDLKKLKEAQGVKDLRGLKVLSGHLDLRTKVHLVDGAKANGRYVTLSHCWGQPKSAQGQLRLTGRTEQKFRKEGIELRDLCKSFRDAMLFAYRLDQVRYIWIDSLCIIQRDPTYTDKTKDPSEQDWKEQSRVMGEVYRQSFLNISATAAKDGDHGLFISRRPEHLWENEVILDHTITDPLNTDGAKLLLNEISKYGLIDLSLWTELVEQAPVNTRGWVQQEIAWECGGFQDVEGFPNGYTTITVRHGDIINERHLKDFDEARGLRLRTSRLRGFPDPDKNLPKLGTYELWKYVVEVYSRTNLTFARDKLIALSGIAEQFSRATKCDYVAGMWREHLESQLLWQVNEDYQDGIFANPACRDELRAPSFSWAAIDSPYGVTYGEATDYGTDRQKQLLFEVRDCEIDLEDPENPFGLIKAGQLQLKPQYLRRIALRKFGPPSQVPYAWRLQEDVLPEQDDNPKHIPSINTFARKEKSSSKKIAFVEHHSLNLDAPASDIDVFASGAELYCMPAAFGDRTVKEAWRDLICLLLHRTKPAQEHPDSKHQFRRIGITRLSSAMHWKSHAILMEQPFEGEIILR
ncbi:hypothetical protein SLS60_005243 [Paraconiothyrium brasiliense]|uniref:Heterokaryon incompatibility domain-containing protein n=1 Tax=Paraconiothyrium brasiliense TaxID=300254 RepID=A0ABR3RGT5_9PLEO